MDAYGRYIYRGVKNTSLLGGTWRNHQSNEQPTWSNPHCFLDKPISNCGGKCHPPLRAGWKNVAPDVCGWRLHRLYGRGGPVDSWFDDNHYPIPVEFNRFNREFYYLNFFYMVQTQWFMWFECCMSCCGVDFDRNLSRHDFFRRMVRPGDISRPVGSKLVRPICVPRSWMIFASFMPSA